MQVLIRENYKFFVGVLIFVGYYFSPLSVFLWSPALLALLHFFLFPFYFLPEDFFIASGGLVAVINPLTIGFAVTIIIFFLFGFSFCVRWVSRKVNVRYSILLVLVLGIVSLVGGTKEQLSCVNNFETSEHKYEGKYLKETGIVQFTLYTPFGKIGAYFFSLFNSLDVVGN